MKQNNILLALVITISTMSILRSATLMPGLKKMKAKLEQAKECTPITFKELVLGEKSKSLKVSPSGVRFVAASNAYGPEERIKDAQEKMKPLHWSFQHDVISSLKLLTQTNKNQALVMIKDLMNKKYTGFKVPLLVFAKDLEAEEQTLKELDQDVTKLVLANDVRSNSELLGQAKTVFADVKKMMSDLQDLIGCVNSLLMS